MIALMLVGGACGAIAHRSACRTSDRMATVTPPRRRTRALGGVLATIAAAGTAMRVPSPWAVPALATFVGVVVALGEIDLIELRISRHVVRGAGAFGALGLLVASAGSHRWHALLTAAVGAAAIFGSFLAIHLLAPHGFGYGDVRMGGLCGLFLGWIGLDAALAGVFAAALLAGAVGMCLLVSGAASSRTRMPFAPFLTLGAVCALLLF